MTKNYMEILVKNALNEIIDKYDICKCDKCKKDIMAIALNNLPPKYFLSSNDESEKTSFLLDRQIKISVLAKVIEAIEIFTSKKNLAL
ncbi:late competence development ComFB family protein [Caldisalinibacter kiritimatiensis]|uniref:Late competence development protein ComFB n=1 Tax=Caldisalinibacter kiritimatiensis TaxID=1304284 RepID=R1CDA7_9FIRM|nr:late competence development ComFB family protein [Caldisalinibacter kiritimatiensis]EOD00280.1 hypothetical protein L21TH_1683 [Caldisalinibacter kiritimatiensis]